MTSQAKILTVFFLFLASISFASAFNVHNNILYENMTAANFVVDPFIVESGDDIYFNFTTKDDVTSINLVFGVNESEIIPNSFSIYSPSWIVTGSIYHCPYNYSNNGSHYKCTQNGVVLIETPYLWANDSDHSAFVQQLEFVEYRQLNLTGGFDYSFDNKTKWYYIHNIEVQPNASNTIKINAHTKKLPFDYPEEYPSFKYDIAIMPSSYGTNINRAIRDDKFLYIDPWVHGNNGLHAVYDMEITGAIINNSIDLSSHNLTTNASVNASCIHNNCLNFNGKQAAWTVDKNPFNDVGTISFWFKANFTTGDRNIFDNTRQAVSNYIRYERYDTDSDYIYRLSDFYTLDKTSARNTAWHFITMAWNSSKNFTFWFDRTKINASTDSAGTLLNAYNMTIGCEMNYNTYCYATSPKYWIGQIDEMYVWTVELNQTDIDELYNSGTGTFYPFVTPCTPTSPTITINYPSEKNITRMTTSITFNYSTTNSNATEFYIDDVLNETFTNANYNFILNKTTAHGLHNWSVKANNSDTACLNVSINSSVYNFTINMTQTPWTALSYPANGSIFNTSTVQLNFSVQNSTDIYLYVDNIIVSTWTGNYTQSINNTFTHGLHSWGVVANNTPWNTTWFTNYYNITINLTEPQTTPVIIINTATFWTNNMTPMINATCSASNTTYILELMFNGTKYGKTACSNNTLCNLIPNMTLTDFTYYNNVTVNCSYNNMTATSASIQVFAMNETGVCTGGEPTTCNLGCLSIATGCTASMQNGCTVIQ